MDQDEVRIVYDDIPCEAIFIRDINIIVVNKDIEKDKQTSAIKLIKNRIRS